MARALGARTMVPTVWSPRYRNPAKTGADAGSMAGDRLAPRLGTLAGTHSAQEVSPEGCATRVSDLKCGHEQRKTVNMSESGEGTGAAAQLLKPATGE